MSSPPSRGPDAFDSTSRKRQQLARLAVVVGEQYGNRGAGRVLAEAILQLAMLKLEHADTGRGQFYMSSYELWDRTGVRRQTCMRWLRRFREDGWLVQVRAADGPLAPVWRVCTDRTTTDVHHQGGSGGQAVCGAPCAILTGQPARNPDGPDSVGHDAWQWRGLGRTAFVLANHLPTCNTVREIAQATGLALRTVYKHAPRLVAMGIWEEAKRTESGAVTYTADPDVDLDVVADLIGTAGLAQARHREVARLRKAHLERLKLAAVKSLTPDHEPRVLVTDHYGLVVDLYTGEIVAASVPPTPPPPIYEEPPEELILEVAA